MQLASAYRSRCSRDMTFPAISRRRKSTAMRRSMCSPRRARSPRSKCAAQRATSTPPPSAWSATSPGCAAHAARRAARIGDGAGRLCQGARRVAGQPVDGGTAGWPMRIPSGLLVAAILAACNQAAEKLAVPPPRVDKNAVIFEPASPQLGSIHTASAEPQREAVLRFNGRLVWDEDRTARVFTPLAGKVMSIAVRAGDAVKAGQMLAVLSAPEFGSAQAEARRAEQDFLLAQKNRTRIEELHAAGVAPAKDLHAALAEEARAASERARTQAKLRAYGGAAADVNQAFVLRSPLSGVVVERQLNPSQELRPDAAPQGGIFVISDPSRLWFVLDVSDRDLGSVRPPESAFWSPARRSNCAASNTSYSSTPATAASSAGQCAWARPATAMR